MSRRENFVELTHFQPMFLRFSDVFRECRSGTLVGSGLKKTHVGTVRRSLRHKFGHNIQKLSYLDSFCVTFFWKPNKRFGIFLSFDFRRIYGLMSCFAKNFNVSSSVNICYLQILRKLLRNVHLKIVYVAFAKSVQFSGIFA